MPKKVVHAVNYAEFEKQTREWRVWTYCWKNFRSESSWVEPLAEFKFLLGQENRPSLCDDCRDEILRPPETAPKYEPRANTTLPVSSVNLRNLERKVDQLSKVLSKLVAGLADP